jgi:hypothetical protein
MLHNYTCGETQVMFDRFLQSKDKFKIRLSHIHMYSKNYKSCRLQL